MAYPGSYSASLFSMYQKLTPWSTLMGTQYSSLSETPQSKPIASAKVRGLRSASENRYVTREIARGARACLFKEDCVRSYPSLLRAAHCCTGIERNRASITPRNSPKFPPDFPAPQDTVRKETRAEQARRTEEKDNESIPRRTEPGPGRSRQTRQVALRVANSGEGQERRPWPRNAR